MTKKLFPIKQAFTDTTSPSYLRVNNLFAFLTLFSVLAIILETVESLSSYSHIFKLIEWGTVLLFSAEYIARVVYAEKKISYILSFYGLIDLLAVLPTYLGLTNLSFLKIARIVRVLRFLRMMRLVKVVRVNKKSGSNNLLQSLSVRIYTLTLFFSVTTFGTIIYLIEGAPNFPNIPTGMLWAMKLTLGGIGHIAPDTYWGDIVAICVRFVGLLLFGVLISIVGKSIERLLTGSNEEEK